MPATIEIKNDIAIITMDDGKANAINPAMLGALEAALDTAEKDAKAVIITGRDGRFSGGFDLKMMMGSPPEEVMELVKRGGRLALRLYQFPMPIVIACTGHAVAMGCFILLSSDVRIGAKGPFKIGANESAINMVLPVFALELLKARISPRHLTHAAINANLFDPEGAVEAGYLDKVLAPDDVLSTAIAAATALSVLTGPAYHSNKKLIRKHTLDTIAPSV